MNVYVAAPLACAWYANRVADELARRRFCVVSSWHRLVRPGDVDPVAHSQRDIILRTNKSEIRLADMMLALCDLGTPNATKSEIGYAQGLADTIGTPHHIIWLEGPKGEGANIFDAHATVVHSLDDAFRALEHLRQAIQETAQ